MADPITALSALDGLLKPGRLGRGSGPAGVVLSEVRGTSIASVIARKGKAGELAAAAERAFAVALPEKPHRVEGKGIAFIWAGPEQWLALARGDLAAGELEAKLAGSFAGLASVAEQSDGRCLLRISGPRARDALAKGLPIDLHPRTFRTNDTALTIAALIGVQIWQLDDAPSYELAVFRGFARSFWHFLTEAAAEYGCEVATD